MNLITNIYKYDDRRKIWIRPDAEPFAYADGVEGQLMEILRKVQDKSVFSPELRSYEKDWPTTYYFSPARANILRPFENTILKDASVLELGAGCGAITRYLGETARKVTAVEGSQDRAAIARERCSDLENVTVIADTIQDLPESPAKYDIVTLIGVLEYAGRFGMKPEEVLKKAKTYLKNNGVLILAIENKMGMRYLGGVPEDHLGLSWAGLVNGYADNGVATWSRKELVNKLKKAGYQHIEQYISLPDYKLPLTIITPEGIDAANKDIIDLSPILTGPSRLFELPPLFNKHEANISMYKAGLMTEMADSLCFIAYPSNPSTGSFVKGSLVEHYGHGPHLQKKYAKKMRIINEDGNIHVKREVLFPLQNNDNFYYVVEDEPYFTGTRLGDKARKVTMRKGWTLEEFAETLRPWVEFILTHKSENNEIDGKYLDFIPSNAILGEDGIVHPFDQEWRSHKPINIFYLLLRGLINTLASIQPVAQPSPQIDLALSTFVKDFFKYFNLEFDYDNLKSLWDGDTIDSYLEQNLPLDIILSKKISSGIDNIALYMVILDICKNLGIHPVKLEQEINKLSKEVRSQKKTINILRKYIENIKEHVKDAQ